MKTSTQKTMNSEPPTQFCSRVQTLCIAIFAVAIFWLTFSAARAQTYTITDLGALGGTNSIASGINNYGQVVGGAANGQSYELRSCFKCDGDGQPCPGGHGCYQTPYAQSRAFIWTPTTPNETNGSLIDLGTFGGPNSGAHRINASGQIIGSATRNQKLTQDFTNACRKPSPPFSVSFCHWTVEYSYLSASFLWGPRRPNGTSGSMTDLGDFSPSGINAAGDMTGGRYLWHNGGLTDLGTLGSVDNGGGTYATDINDLRQIVGWSMATSNGWYRPFLWQNGVMKDLGTTDDRMAVSTYNILINTNGQIVGTLADVHTAPHNFLFTIDSSGTVISRARLGDLPGAMCRPEAINNQGQVVGTAYTNGSPINPFFWDGDHGMRDLNTLLVPGSGWTLINANGINDVGQIVGTGVNPSGQTHAFLLTRLPAPILALAATQSTGQFRFTLVGEANRTYTIQASSNLVNWMALTNFTSATGTNQFTDTGASSFSRRFYRAVVP